MKNVNLVFDSIILCLFLSFITPVIMHSYENLGVTLPVATKLLLLVGDFWRSYYYFPVLSFLSIAVVVTNYITFFKNNKYTFLFRIPLLISLIGSIVFLPMPILSSLNL